MKTTVIPDSVFLLHEQQPTCGRAGECLPYYLPFGTLYRFRAKGEVLPAHTHREEKTGHFTIVLEGEVAYHTEKESLKLTAPALMRVPLNVRHWFEALTDTAEILNMPDRLLEERV
jgi:hypothetical protein